MTLNMHPDNLLLARGYAEIVQSFGWRSFTIVYESERGRYEISNVRDIVRD